jgi:Transglutaminase-like superfamily
MSRALIGRLTLLEKLALAAEIGREYVRVRLALRRGGLQHALAETRAVTPGALLRRRGRLTMLDDLRLARASILVLRLLPTDTRCLMRSLVVLALLARRGRTATLVIGVEPGEEFRAHSWLERADDPILPPEGFPPLVAL